MDSLPFSTCSGPLEGDLCQLHQHGYSCHLAAVEVQLKGCPGRRARPRLSFPSFRVTVKQSTCVRCQPQGRTINTSAHCLLALESPRRAQVLDGTMLCLHSEEMEPDRTNSGIGSLMASWSLSATEAGDWPTHTHLVPKAEGTYPFPHCRTDTTDAI